MALPFRSYQITACKHYGDWENRRSRGDLPAPYPHCVATRPNVISDRSANTKPQTILPRLPCLPCHCLSRICLTIIYQLSRSHVVLHVQANKKKKACSMCCNVTMTLFSPHRSSFKDFGHLMKHSPPCHATDRNCRCDKT